MAHLGGPATSAVGGLFEGWVELVGEQVAEHTLPKALRDGVLSVDVDDPAWANQLKYLEVDLLGRIAAQLGEGVVTEIRWRVRGAPRRS
jgi:predicted nucleic acid-binding Zn ribbon protein